MRQAPSKLSPCSAEADARRNQTAAQPSGPNQLLHHFARESATENVGRQATSFFRRTAGIRDNQDHRRRNGESFSTPQCLSHIPLCKAEIGQPEGISAEKMKECMWIKPVAVV
jgi:hypothetical protein